jgi:hypothetical protein
MQGQYVLKFPNIVRIDAAGSQSGRHLPSFGELAVFIFRVEEVI